MDTFVCWTPTGPDRTAGVLDAGQCSDESDRPAGGAEPGWNASGRSGPGGEVVRKGGPRS